MSVQIGKLAKTAQVNIQTIRFYERKGLLPPPKRTKAGYRLYPPTAVNHIRFIKQAQSLGFSLEEIRDLLDLRIEPNSNCEKVRLQAQGKIDQMNAKINELQRLVQTLESLVDDCINRKTTDICPILGSMEPISHQID